MVAGYFGNDRRAHWVKLNHQCRIPKRWVFFDTETQSERIDGEEVQTWRTGAAVRWRHGLKRGDYVERCVFDTPLSLWQWVTAFCHSEQRTIVFAHNLGFDTRIAQILDILPTLGWQLEWCNLDRNVSAMKWKGPNGTLVFADTWTWLPLALESVAPDVGMTKMRMPTNKASLIKWQNYCANDAEIGYRVVKELLAYIDSADLGNWQPTGAGMAYATWRHKFLTDKVLVHDDEEAIAAERAAMHTGRAEAWRHGKLENGLWTEIDLRNAYVSIAADTAVPCKLRMATGAITISQYQKLQSSSRILAHCYIETDVPCVPTKHDGRTLWPVGHFESWLWDAEIDLLIESGQYVKIKKAYVYTSKPVLAAWAKWVLDTIHASNEEESPVVRTWLKHCSRALIGRIALRTPTWELFGENPSGDTGITYMLDAGTNKTHRLMHVGDRTLIETERREGRDSLPQITGYVMSVCRAELWRAIAAAGSANVAHVDTDSLLVNPVGLQSLRGAYSGAFDRVWAVKGTWRKLVVYGPRNYRCGSLRKTAGIPKKATEVLPNVFTGEQWHGLATDIEDGRSNAVTISDGHWDIKKTDPRRRDHPGVGTFTLPYEVGVSVLTASSSASSSGSGE